MKCEICDDTGISGLHAMSMDYCKCKEGIAMRKESDIGFASVMIILFIIIAVIASVS